MVSTIERLRAAHSKPDGGSGSTGRPPRSPLRHAPPPPEDVVDLEDDGTDEAEPPPSRPRKRRHAQMEDSHQPFHSCRQFHPAPKRQNPPPPPPTAGARAAAAPPPHPICVKPIAFRSPSPDRLALLVPRSPGPQAAPAPPVTPVPPMQASRGDSDVASVLRKERQAFYVRAAAAARGSVTMDVPKPAFRPPIQPPGLFYLLPCGLLKFDPECGEFHAFQEDVANLKSDPAFMDRVFAAYGRFHSAKHQVTSFSRSSPKH